MTAMASAPPAESAAADDAPQPVPATPAVANRKDAEGDDPIQMAALDYPDGPPPPPGAAAPVPPPSYDSAVGDEVPTAPSAGGTLSVSPATAAGTPGSYATAGDVQVDIPTAPVAPAPDESQGACEGGRGR